MHLPPKCNPFKIHIWWSLIKYFRFLYGDVLCRWPEFGQYLTSTRDSPIGQPCQSPFLLAGGSTGVWCNMNGEAVGGGGLGSQIQTGSWHFEQQQLELLHQAERCQLYIVMLSSTHSSGFEAYVLKTVCKVVLSERWRAGVGILVSPGFSVYTLGFFCARRLFPCRYGYIQVAQVQKSCYY